jgi:hypothetical protein
VLLFVSVYFLDLIFIHILTSKLFIYQKKYRDSCEFVDRLLLHCSVVYDL